MANPAYYYTNVAVQNTIGDTGGISSSATTVYCASTPSGYPQNFPFKLRLEPGSANEEVVKVTAGAGTSASPWTIVRGWDGTTAKTHAAGAALAHGMSAEDLILSREHEADDSTSSPLPHGLPVAAWQSASFAVVDETTLTNSTTAVVSWSSIPQTYTHLMLVAQGRLTYTGAEDGDVVCTINGDSSSAYGYFEIGAGTETGALQSPWSGAAYGQSNWAKFITLAASQVGTSVNAGGGFMIFPNYSGTTLNKMAVGLSGFGNGSVSNGVGKTRWCFYNPATQTGISSLSLAASVGNFQSGTFLGLYGIS